MRFMIFLSIFAYCVVLIADACRTYAPDGGFVCSIVLQRKRIVNEQIQMLPPNELEYRYATWKHESINPMKVLLVYSIVKVA